MKLHEIKPLRLYEEPIPTQDAEEVWSSNASDAASYITSVVYDVKPTPGRSGTFDVTFDKNGRRQLYGSISKEDLNAAFTPLRRNQMPDAEGYLQYRSSVVYDAFKYGGDPVKVNLGEQPDGDAETVLMNKDDYLLRQTTGSDFTYTIEKSDYFDLNYVKKS